MLESATFYSGVLPEMFEEYAQHMRENLLTDKNIFDTTIRQQVETL
jgi:hypothetical protein